MRTKFTTLISTALVALLLVTAVSCKKQGIKKVVVDNQMAVSLFCDTISLREILGKMDITTQNWLRVREDSIFAYYADSVKDVIKASDLLGNINDVNFNTKTNFTLPEFENENTQDTVLLVDKFATIPFHYDGFGIDEVILRSGDFSFGFEVTPAIPWLKSIELYSNQLLDEDGEPFSLVLNYNKGDQHVDLSNYRIVPENDTVSFSSRVTMHCDAGYVFEGGDYQCALTGGLTNVRFKTVYGTITTPLDSTYNDQTTIDFGINGISGEAYLPIPRIYLTYRNTFGFGAGGYITKLDFVNTNNQLVTNLLVQDSVEVNLYSTNGEWYHSRITGFTENIDALAGYTRMDFDGGVRMLFGNGKISVSDTSAIDVLADIEIPFSLKLSDMHYTDTFAVDFSGASGASEIYDYIDEIDFYVDYRSGIRINVEFQAEFLYDNMLIETLYDNPQAIEYGSSLSHLDPCEVTGNKLNNVLRANRMVLKLGATTPGTAPIMMMDTDDLFLRMRVRTKTSEVNIEDI